VSHFSVPLALHITSQRKTMTNNSERKPAPRRNPELLLSCAVFGHPYRKNKRNKEGMVTPSAYLSNNAPQRGLTEKGAAFQQTYHRRQTQ
jgi:hypothetical protein